MMHTPSVIDGVRSKVTKLRNMTVKNGCTAQESASADAIVIGLIHKYGAIVNTPESQAEKALRRREASAKAKDKRERKKAMDADNWMQTRNGNGWFFFWRGYRLLIFDNRDSKGGWRVGLGIPGQSGLEYGSGRKFEDASSAVEASVKGVEWWMEQEKEPWRYYM